MKSAKNNDVRGNNQEKRPPSSLSTGSSDSGVFSSGPVVSASQPTEPSSAAQTGPPSPITQFNSLIYQAANLMAVNEQLRKELAENQQLQSIQRQMCYELNKSPDQPPQQVVSPPIAAPQSAPPPSAAAPAASIAPSTQQPLHQSAPNSIARPPRDGRERRLQKPEAYKTVICQAWLESKTCAFSENCRFAHGEEELRPSKVEPRQNNKYKTKLCDKYTTTGLCPYGKRCLFIHPDHGPNAYIRADKLFEISQRHALADLRDQMESQIMSGGRSVFTPQSSIVPPPQMLMRPTTPIESANKPPATVPLGPTPVSLRGPRYAPLQSRNSIDTARPHPSWPLEPSSFYGIEKPSSRPVSPFEMLLGAAAANTNMYTMLGNSATPSGASGYVSGGSTPYTDLDSTGFSPASALQNPVPASNLNVKMIPPNTPFLNNEDDSFSMVPGSSFDHLAEDMAKHLDLW